MRRASLFLACLTLLVACAGPPPPSSVAAAQGPAISQGAHSARTVDSVLDTGGGGDRY